ncbi:T9SS type A sorting domain-containing protein [Bernardetia sp. Wsw4-3y2]|uniref:T9SS type A sorting domain-containing protein n=1 Tax=Bernardetia sp. Wsw4-3y2 TaxID=3127471 RepID=UPI0030D18A4C
MKNIFLIGITSILNLFLFYTNTFAQCPVGQGELKVVLYTDRQSSVDNDYTVKVDGVTVATGAIGSLANQQVVELYIGCHANNSMVEVTVNDNDDDGISDISLNGSDEDSPDFNIQYEGVVILSGDVIESGGLLTPTGGLPLSCSGTNERLIIKLYPDSFSDTENSYSIKINGAVVASGAVGSLPDETGTDYNLYVGCHAPTDIVEVEILDNSGDGIEPDGNYNSPSWRMSYGGIPLLSSLVVGDGGILTPPGGLQLKPTCGTNQVPLYMSIYTDSFSDTENSYSISIGGTVVASGAVGTLPEENVIMLDLGCQTIGDDVSVTFTDNFGDGISASTGDATWILYAAGNSSLCESSLIASGEVNGSGTTQIVPIEIPLCGFADCEFKRPLCVDLTTTLTFSSGTARGAVNEIITGVDFGCLGASERNSAWYYLQVDPSAPTNSTLSFQMIGNLNADYDYAVWGPFTRPDVCGADLGAPTDCSFSFTSNETVTLTNVNPNEYYVFMISRYGDTETTHTLVQLAGSTASTTCSIVTNPCSLQLPDDYSICAGETTTLTAGVTPNSSSWSYQWFLNGTAITGATNRNYTVPEQFASTTFTQNYRVEASNSAFGCNVQDDIILTIRAGEFDLDLGDDISRCDAAGEIILNASDPSQGAGFTYQWFENGVAINGATNSTLNVNFTSTGGNPVTNTYRVIVTDSSPTGCSQADEIDVTFVPDPIISLGADIIACDAFGTVTLNAADASHGSTISYQWFRNGVAINGATNATLDVSFASQAGVAQTRTYRAEVTDSRGTGCTQADEVEVTFKPNLVVNLGQDLEYCENVFQFNINASDATHSGNMTYELFENGTSIATSNSPLFSVSINEPNATTLQTRTYRVKATDNTSLGCTTVSNDLKVTYNYKPLIIPIADRIDVECTSNQLTAQISNQNDNHLTYSWMYSGANTQYEISTTASVLVNRSGTYTLTVTATLNNGTTCSSVESFVLKCNEDPIPEYVPVLTGQAGYSYVDLEWTDVPEGMDFLEFEVYMGIGDEEPTILASITPNTFARVDLLNGRKYSFRVRPIYVNQGGNNYELGAYSNIVYLTPSIVLGQDETDKRSAISLFPNPSNGSFTVEFKAIQAQKANLTVVDLTGKVILTQSLSDLNNGSKQNIELNGVSSGVYIVQVQTEKGVYQQKITIMK